MALLWNTIKEAARAAKGQMSKNARNAAKAETKKERGPVKAFFHITKNENVPAIEQQGLLTNHPNANINSANHPFRKHGTDAGGVWVTTEPTAFPVYGTTIGGKNGNAAARADALSTFKIEVPLPELRKMKAVQDPYGKNILRKGDDPRAVEKFGTWAGIGVPTTVLLNDVKPQWLKNIGYVEELNPKSQMRPTMPELRWEPRKALDPKLYGTDRDLSKADRAALSMVTGHDRNLALHPSLDPDYSKSPARFVDDYTDRNRPIRDRLPVLPLPDPIDKVAWCQGALNGVKHVWTRPEGFKNVFTAPAPNEFKRYSVNFIPAQGWTDNYQPYVKPGESVTESRGITFAPGAISRGMGGQFMPSVKERNFDWNKYKQLVTEGETPSYATFVARPRVILDWNNIVYKHEQYIPKPRLDTPHIAIGAVSRGTPDHMKAFARIANSDRRKAADIIRRERDESIKYLSHELGRKPTTEEIDNWTRAGIFNKIESGDIDAPKVLGDWSDKVDWDVVDRLTHELGGD